MRVQDVEVKPPTKLTLKAFSLSFRALGINCALAFVTFDLLEHYAIDVVRRRGSTERKIFRRTV